MHREINKTIEGMFTDHINGNKLDNRRNNLRTVTSSENQANTDLRKSNTSGYRGVHKHSKNRWRSSINKNDIKYNLGSFKTKIEAARAYNKKALELFGEYARLNKLED